MNAVQIKKLATRATHVFLNDRLYKIAEVGEKTLVLDVGNGTSEYLYQALSEALRKPMFLNEIQEIDNAPEELEKLWTLFWIGGERSVITGPTIEAAFSQAGWGAGALRALDFHMHGDCHDYAWDANDRAWRKI